MPHKDPEAKKAYLARTLEHRRQVHRLWAQAHTEERKTYMAQRREDPEIAEKRKKYQKEYDLVHAEEISAKRQAIKLAMSEEELEVIRQHDREFQRAKRAANPEAAHANDHMRRQLHGAHIDTLARARRLANPEPFRATDRKRSRKPGRKLFARNNASRHRAAKANAPINDLTAAQWLEIQSAQDHRCTYCGKRAKGHLTQDHITPLSQGGSHTLANVIGACKSCNSRKGTRPPPIPVQPLLLTIASAKQPKAS